MANQSPRTPVQEEEINLREELEKYLKYWPWFLIGVLISVFLAFIYIKISIPEYSNLASIIIKDEESKVPSSDMSSFSDLGLLEGMGTNSIENEIGILRSRQMMTNIVKELGLNISYFEEGALKDKEIYNNSPYLIDILKLDEEKLSLRLQEGLGNIFRVEERKNNRFLIENIETGEEYSGKFGSPLELDFGSIILRKRETQRMSSDIQDVEVVFEILPTDRIVRKYQNLINVELTDDNSTLIELELTEAVREKARDILDQLVLEYNKQAINDKNAVAKNTAEFIDERLIIINEELDSVEIGKEEFKENNNLTDIETEAQLFIENASEYNKEREQVGTQLELANAMIGYLESSSKSDLLPANLGIDENGINSSIGEYNQIVLERNRLLSASTEENPAVRKLNAQIEQLSSNILRGLQRLKSNLEIAKADLDSQVASIGSKISAVPSTERQFRGIERQQNIKEALYLFLLEKREENSLSLAVTAPKAKIVDHAYSSPEPVFPKKNIILLGAFIVGLIIPFLIIYLRYLLDNKINSREDVERVLKNIPIVGELPRISKKETDLIAVNDRSVLSEAFRMMVTNLQYLLVNAGDKEKGIKLFVTSTVKGEGKTFTAFNLAITFANMGKKVLIIGADLRNPQLQRYEEGALGYSGVTDYLVGSENSLEAITKTSKVNENLHLISSGNMPPNPSELLRSKRMGEMFTQLEQEYDYIIVDTAPAMLVADTFLINKFADLSLYVARAGYTEKKLLNFVKDTKSEGKLHDVCIVLNDVELANFGYGNKYGYSYGQEELGFWEKIKSKF